MTRGTITFTASSTTLRAMLTVGLLSWVLVACSQGPTQQVTVLMTDRGMSVEPRSVDDTARFEFRFVNDGSGSRHPVVVVTTMTPDDLRRHIEQNGIQQVITALLEESSDTWELIYPALESGQSGHYHPGEEDLDLPGSALTRSSEDGEVVHYLYSDAVEPETERTKTVVCCKSGVTYGNRGGGTTFLALTIDGSEHYAIFDLLP